LFGAAALSLITLGAIWAITHKRAAAKREGLHAKLTRALHPLPGLNTPASQRYQAILPERGLEPLSEYDSPLQDAIFFQAQRMPPENRRPGSKPILYAKYLNAARQLWTLPQFSTSLNRKLPSRATMAGLGQISLSANSLVQSATPPARSSSVLGTWVGLGPDSVGGRTRCLIIDPTDPNIMYAAAASGGVWKSRDAGKTWSPVADFLGNIAVNALAMDPGNHQVLFAGTGEGYFNVDATRGQGIFQTTDGGLHWNQLVSTNTKDFYYVRKIAISPSDSARIYATTATGLFRSDNSGSTWTRALDQTNVLGCLDLAIQTSAPSYIFVSCGTFYPAVILRSVDRAGPQQWQEVLRLPGMGRTSLALAPSDQKTIYALAASIANGPLNGGLLGVFRSDSNGDQSSWNATIDSSTNNSIGRLVLSNPVQAVYRDCFGQGTDQYLNQGWYDNVIAVDPKDPNIVWAGGTDLFRSDDGGRKWGVASYWWFEQGRDPEYAHADHHVIVFDPSYNGTSNQVMFVGNDGGIFASENARGTVGTELASVCGQVESNDVHWAPRNGGYAVTQFYSGAVLPNGSSYFGGTQDNGTVLGNAAGTSATWKTIQGGDGGFVAYDPRNPSILYTAFYGPSIRKSGDGGATFTDANNGLCACGQSCQSQSDCSVFSFITPFALDALKPDVLWTGGDQLFRSVNGGNSWQPASSKVDAGHYPLDSPPADSGSLSSIAIRPTDSNFVLAGFAPNAATGAGGGWIHRIDTALSSTNVSVWPRVRPRSGWVSSIAFDQSQPQIAYATYSSFNSDDGLDKGHVFKSSDGGQTWKLIDGIAGKAVPDIPVHSLVVDPSDSNRLYIGTDLAVLVSLDGGNSWNVEASSFPNVVVQKLVIVPGSPPRLYAFTHGRGLWLVEIKP
jgi:photosystem II stability/assembly factor-like uncharacterized protein